MRRIPIDLSMTTKTTKVSVKAWDRVLEIKERHDVRVSDIVSACLLYMPEDELEKILKQQADAIDSLPKSVKGMLRNLDRISDEETGRVKSYFRDALRRLPSLKTDDQNPLARNVMEKRT